MPTVRTEPEPMNDATLNLCRQYLAISKRKEWEIKQGEEMLKFKRQNGTVLSDTAVDQFGRVVELPSASPGSHQ